MLNLLEGVTVVDFTTIVLGPYATQFLGDFGANVIKVESLDGDNFRAVRPGHSPEMGAGFINCNRNKKSIAINLKSPEGQAVRNRLIKKADIVVHNMRGKTAKGLGLSYEDVCELNPRVVLCYAPGFSQAGPNADLPAYDDIIQAASGIAALNADSTGQPRFLPTILCDKVGGLHLALAAAGGIAYQLRTGKGCEIEVPMFESTVAFLMAEQLAGQSFIPPLGNTGYDRLLSPNRRPFKSADGYISLLPYSTRHWKSFLELIDEPELAVADWVTNPVKRSQNIDLLYQVVANAMPSRTTAEWYKLLSERDIPCTPVNRLDDLFKDPHLQETGFFEEYTHLTEGTLRQAKAPFNARGVNTMPDQPAPTKGQHNRSLLLELGFSNEDITTMEANGTISG